jgi:hypothetical protein
MVVVTGLADNFPQRSQISKRVVMQVVDHFKFHIFAVDDFIQIWGFFFIGGGRTLGFDEGLDRVELVLEV